MSDPWMRNRTGDVAWDAIHDGIIRKCTQGVYELARPYKSDYFVTKIGDKPGKWELIWLNGLQLKRRQYLNILKFVRDRFIFIVFKFT